MTPSDTEIMEIATKHANLFRVPPMIGKLGTDPLAETIGAAIKEYVASLGIKPLDSQYLAMMKRHLELWRDSCSEENPPSLDERMETMLGEALALRDANWQDGNATLRHERDALARWKQEALQVEAWWSEIDAFIRKHPDTMLGVSMSGIALAWMKERDELKRTVTDLQFACEGFKAKYEELACKNTTATKGATPSATRPEEP